MAGVHSRERVSSRTTTAFSCSHLRISHLVTVRDTLHRLVDVLPDDTTETAVRVLEALATTAVALDPAARAALLAPDDDEPETEDERAGVAEARAELAAGRGLSAAEVRAALGLA